MTSYNGNTKGMEEYRSSIRFKMCYILAVYRRIACLLGVEFTEKMRRLYAQIDCTKDYIFDENFLVLVETGYIGLSENEVKLYAMYIANFYNFDFEDFYNNLKAEASTYSFSNDLKEDNVALLEAISMITLRINSKYKED